MSLKASIEKDVARNARKRCPLPVAALSHLQMPLSWAQPVAAQPSLGRHVEAVVATEVEPVVAERPPADAASSSENDEAVVVAEIGPVVAEFLHADGAGRPSDVVHPDSLDLVAACITPLARPQSVGRPEQLPSYGDTALEDGVSTPRRSTIGESPHVGVTSADGASKTDLALDNAGDCSDVEFAENLISELLGTSACHSSGAQGWRCVARA